MNQNRAIVGGSQVIDELPVPEEFLEARGKFQGLQVSPSRWRDIGRDWSWLLGKSGVCPEDLEWRFMSAL